MFFIVALLILFIIYIFTFNKDFEPDDIGRVTAWGIAIGIIAVVTTIIGSLNS